MNLCPSCGLKITQGEMCRHHEMGEHNWAASNRIMCDFFHRKRIPRRITPNEQDVAQYRIVENEWARIAPSLQQPAQDIAYPD